MKKWKKCPLLIVTAISMLLVSGVALAGTRGAYKEYNKDWPKVPAVAGMMQASKEGILPWDKVEPEEDLESVYADKEEPATEEATEAVADTEAEEDKTYEFTDVTQDYFDDAVFIGDSRTVGLRDYGGWDNATFYASIGLTVYDMFDTPIVEENGTKITVQEALSEHQFGKVYLMIGINEMGTGTVDSFMKAYEEAVNHIRELQPDALIFLQGIMYVKQEKSETDPIFNNPAIKERNDRIAMLANNHDIFYIDVNEVVTDETGNLNPEYTYDEIHLLGKYYSLWTDFLLKHGIKKE